MNGHLVIIRHDLDDLPVMLFDDIKDARLFAEKAAADPEEYGREFCKLASLDATTPNCVAIVSFHCGHPVAMEFIDIPEEGAA